MTIEIARISVFSDFSQTEAYDAKEVCIRLSHIFETMRLPKLRKGQE